ncbi:MAG: TRAP transporter small permease, partial [Rhodobacterales bacterium CG_4_9_14_3_um_filter_71_31]
MTDDPPPLEAMPHLDEAAEAAATDISDFSWSDAPSLALFWALAGVVFLQFFSRYVMNSSIGWTEEIARYLLIGVTFV